MTYRDEKTKSRSQKNSRYNCRLELIGNLFEYKTVDGNMAKDYAHN